MVLHDLRYAVRTFRKSPAFIAAAVLTLGLGIGANTAVFTLIHSLLLRPLPVKDPASLALFRSQTAQTAWNPSIHFTHPIYLELAKQSPVFEGLAAFMTRPVGVTVDRSSERLHLEIVSGNYFQLLGVKPALGRLLRPGDPLCTSASVAMRP